MQETNPVKYTETGGPMCTEVVEEYDESGLIVSRIFQAGKTPSRKACLAGKQITASHCISVYFALNLKVDGQVYLNRLHSMVCGEFARGVLKKINESDPGVMFDFVDQEHRDGSVKRGDECQLTVYSDDLRSHQLGPVTSNPTITVHSDYQVHMRVLGGKLIDKNLTSKLSQRFRKVFLDHFNEQFGAENEPDQVPLSGAPFQGCSNQVGDFQKYHMGTGIPTLTWIEKELKNTKIASDSKAFITEVVESEVLSHAIVQMSQQISGENDDIEPERMKGKIAERVMKQLEERFTSERSHQKPRKERSLGGASKAAMRRLIWSIFDGLDWSEKAMAKLSIAQVNRVARYKYLTVARVYSKVEPWKSRIELWHNHFIGGKLSFEEAIANPNEYEFLRLMVTKFMLVDKTPWKLQEEPCREYCRTKSDKTQITCRLKGGGPIAEMDPALVTLVEESERIFEENGHWRGKLDFELEHEDEDVNMGQGD